MRIFLVTISALLLLSFTSSCKRCITCEYENEFGKIEVTQCAAGPGSKKELDNFEKELKEGFDDVVCRRD